MTPSSSPQRYHRLDCDSNEYEPSSALSASGGGSSAGDVELQSIRKWPAKSADSDDSFTENLDGSGRADLNPLLIQGDAAGQDNNNATSRTSNKQQIKPQVYPQRWIQLGYLSTLALLSDWVCFSTASIPDVFEGAYPGKTSEGLIDKFLFVNVVSCLCVTDLVTRFGLQKCTKASSLLMAVGCWLRSGLGIVTVIFELLGIKDDYNSFLETEVFGMPLFGLPPYPVIMTGTLMVGMAQPFFQCTPPLLSAQWFASNERATSSAIALNFNQVGIAAAFVVGGFMADGNDGLMRYFALIATASTILSIGTFMHFENLPPVPPSASELGKMVLGQQHEEPPFRVSVKSFFRNPGFCRPLAAFIWSIAITNVVGAFIDEVMERGGVSDRRAIAWAGCGFEFAIVLGGIILGRYVDRTKKYKSVTLYCIALSLIFILPLGLTQHKIGQEPVLLIVSIFFLGFFVGPVQPINAELAVDVTFPGDETAVESVQQFGGNFCSALLVPVAGRAAKLDYQLLPSIPLLASDIRGDVIFMMALAIATFCFYRSFDAPLRRSMADGD
eukprot:CAMPEP_0172324754 /NCGR_PEP_ID=MMETSP1058-20130122/52178_1 /TAXON_ID=83371 /ORGANISM="Detonula confervacea, Strain CCMP 353" /LENGTH=555 /DNA_ID=CAMNT_0013041119 /DNA_START=67 /DNA_END=1734 /DNA_ORIENTATION=+